MCVYLCVSVWHGWHAACAGVGRLIVCDVRVRGWPMAKMKYDYVARRGGEIKRWKTVNIERRIARTHGAICDDYDDGDLIKNAGAHTTHTKLNRFCVLCAAHSHT